MDKYTLNSDFAAFVGDGFDLCCSTLCKISSCSFKRLSKINHSELRVFHIQKSPLAGVESPAAKSVVLRVLSKEQVKSSSFLISVILQQGMEPLQTFEILTLISFYHVRRFVIGLFHSEFVCSF